MKPKNSEASLALWREKMLWEYIYKRIYKFDKKSQWNYEEDIDYDFIKLMMIWRPVGTTIDYEAIDDFKRREKQISIWQERRKPIFNDEKKKFILMRKDVLNLRKQIKKKFILQINSEEKNEYKTTDNIMQKHIELYLANLLKACKKKTKEESYLKINNKMKK